MLTDLRQSLSAAALVVSAAGLLAAPLGAGAQSLSLTYKLDPVNAAETPKASPLVDRCSGLTWAAALAAACTAEATARRPIPVVAAAEGTASAAPEAAAEDAPPARREGADSYSATDPAPRRYVLPVLGSPAEARVLRASGAGDYIGNARSVDVNFRFGSKYRMRSAEEGWEVYKFSDVTSENRLQTNGVRNVGVELLFPFQ